MERGAEYIGSGTRLMLGLTLIANGKAREGMEIIEETQRWWIQSGSRMRYVQSLYVAGKTFAQIFQRSNQGVCSTLSEGITAPDDVCFAQQKALEYLNKATEIAEEIGAKDHLSKCYLALGLLLIAMGEIVKAEGCLSRALALFRECDAELLLKQAQEALSSIKPET